jgi:hypothetical protein
VSANLITLEHEIAEEERIVGIPTDEPLTSAAIDRRHTQIGLVLGLASMVTIATLVSATSTLRVLTSALALAFGIYALRKERHLRRLTDLYRDECSIHLDVADIILRSGALRTDRELLDLRSAVEVGAARLAADLGCVVPAECTALRLVGPGGETPLAAVSDLGSGGHWLDPATAHAALQRHEPIRRGARDGRTVIAVPLEHHHDVVGILEVVSRPHETYSILDTERVAAFASGAVSGLLSVRHGMETS